MRRRVSRLGSLFVAVWLAGCGGGKILIDPETPVVLDGTLKLQPQIAWSRIESGQVETWTVDGAALNRLDIVKGASDGDPLLAPVVRVLFYLTKEDEGALPAFDRAMTALEVHDLYVATLSRLGHVQIETQDIRPWRIGAHPGFRFAFRHERGDGIERRGLAVGFLDDEKLWLITYTAPAVHYFEKYRSQVEALFASMSLL